MCDQPHVNPDTLSAAAAEAVSPAPATAPTTQAPAVPSPAAPVYRVLDACAAWICLLIGYLSLCVFPVSDNPLGGALLMTVLFLAVPIFLRLGKYPLSGESVAVILTGIAASVSLVVSVNAFLHVFAYAYAWTALLYLLYSATGSKLEGRLSSLLFADLIRALFVLPFLSFKELFAAIRNERSRKGGAALLRLLLGLALALVPTVVVLLLLSYDRDFTHLLNRILSFTPFDIIRHLFRMALGIPIGMYLFGLYASGRNGRDASGFTAEACHTAAKSVRIAPALTAAAAGAPLLLIYGVFFVSQWKYYVSAFSGCLPDGILPANYARDGFFQLCTVSAINLAVTAAISFFTKRKGEKPGWTVRILTLLFTVSTLVLLATAVSKMVLYIDCFGLTHKRVYACWFMAVITVLFLMISLKQFVTRFPLIPAATSAVVLLFALLSLSGVDGWIAGYNVDRYLDGSLSSVDVDAMDALGDAAVPAMCRLQESLDGTYGEGYCQRLAKQWSFRDFSTASQERYLCFQTGMFLQNAAETVRQDGDNVFAGNLPRWQARRALVEAGLLTEP